MHLPPLIIDLAYILGVAAVVTLIFRRLRQPVVLGYILTGVIVGPYMPGPSVGDTESIKVWAELGVVFLMFALGLEFSFRKLASIGFAAAMSGVIQIAAMFGLGYLTANILGWNHSTGMFLGGMLAISSTTIILKVFEELKLKGRRFTDMVFGILIVEDLAAILILVALSSFGGSDAVDGIALLRSTGQLILVVGTWFLFGMFIVPRFMRSVGRHGSDELIVLSSIALCLGLVSLAARFEYSVALGAFMMGSILAETRDAKRIETLVAPFKDIFGAVFFVSVGMLLDPQILKEEWFAIIAVSLVVLAGKILSVFTGSLVTGQSISDSTKISLSMAQIGEFSFIIATLGLSLGAIEPKLYPIIVSTSLITTFMTPYLIRNSEGIAAALEDRLPPRLALAYSRYCLWLERRLASPGGSKGAYLEVARWVSCALTVVAIFAMSARFVPIWVSEMNFGNGRFIAWLVAFVFSMPFIGAMIFPSKFGVHNEVRRSNRRLSILGSVMAVLLVGLLSQEFLSLEKALALTSFGVLLLLFVLRRRLESRYRWIENHFLSGFSDKAPEVAASQAMERTRLLSKSLAPWSVHLQEVSVPVASVIAAKTLAELQLRERFGINVVCVERGEQLIVTPLPTERLLPGDRLLVFGDDADVVRFLKEAATVIEVNNIDSGGDDLSRYRVFVLTLDDNHQLVGKTIRASRLREDHGCLVVGIERFKERLKNPSSDLGLAVGDVLWIVGPTQKLEHLKQLKA